MRNVCTGVLVGLLMAALACAQDKKKEEAKIPPPSAAEQYAQLVKDYSKAQADFFVKYRAAKTSEEKSKLVQTLYPRPQKYAAKFMELAEKYPNDPAAVKALTWVASNAGSSPEGQKAIDLLLDSINKNTDDPLAFNALLTVATRSRGRGADKALALLKDKFIDSGKLGTVCLSLIYNTSKGTQEFLRTVMEKSPHKDVQGAACYALAKVRMRLGPGSEKEAEQLLDRVTSEYKDVEVRGRSLAKMAEADLFEIRFLSIGKVAPDIDGEDLDGVQFKLSDYRGKVVVLDFWGNW